MKKLKCENSIPKLTFYDELSIKSLDYTRFRDTVYKRVQLYNFLDLKTSNYLTYKIINLEEELISHFSTRIICSQSLWSLKWFISSELLIFQKRLVFFDDFEADKFLREKVLVHVNFKNLTETKKVAAHKIKEKSLHGSVYGNYSSKVYDFNSNSTIMDYNSDSSFIKANINKRNSNSTANESLYDQSQLSILKGTAKDETFPNSSSHLNHNNSEKNYNITKVNNSNTSINNQQNPNSSINNPNSSINNPNSCINNPNSSINNPNSSINNPNSSINNPNSSINNTNSSINNTNPSNNNEHYTNTNVNEHKINNTSYQNMSSHQNYITSVNNDVFALDFDSKFSINFFSKLIPRKFLVHFTLCLSGLAEGVLNFENGYFEYSPNLSKFILESLFKNFIANETYNLFEKLKEEMDERFIKIHSSLFEKPTFTETIIDTATAEFNYPPCISKLITKFSNQKHLKFRDRLVLIRFYKDAGVKVEDCIQFFRNNFNVTSDVFDKEYLYSIRHAYGLEGKRGNYFSYNCNQTIASTQDINTFGCPFVKNESPLKEYLKEKEVDSKTIVDIEDCINDKNYIKACQSCLSHLTKDESIIGAIKHSPIEFFFKYKKYSKDLQKLNNKQ